MYATRLTDRSWRSDLDSESFVEIVSLYHADFLRLAGAMTGDAELARDIAQSAWVAAWQHRSELRDPAKLRGWLLTITANQARAALRKRRLQSWLRISATTETAQPTDLAESRLDLIAALQRLPVRDRQILALRYALGETSAEIGRQCGLAESAVRVRIGRLLRRLREDLGND
jgi:RNA polymerase sigma factor (sigma-70 family)